MSTVQTVDSENSDSFMKDKAQQSSHLAAALWYSEPMIKVSNKANVKQSSATAEPARKRESNLVHASVKSAQIEPLLLFQIPADGEFVNSLSTCLNYLQLYSMCLFGTFGPALFNPETGQQKKSIVL